MIRNNFKFKQTRNKFKLERLLIVISISPTSRFVTGNKDTRIYQGKNGLTPEPFGWASKHLCHEHLQVILIRWLENCGRSLRHNISPTDLLPADSSTCISLPFLYLFNWKQDKCMNENNGKLDNTDWLWRVVAMNSYRHVIKVCHSLTPYIWLSPVTQQWISMFRSFLLQPISCQNLCLIGTKVL